MLSPLEFRELVSGRRRGWRASLVRLGLLAAEVPYGLAVRWRNRRYDRRPGLVHRVGVPVVSVGNLTVGGTGKTPVVEWLARWFRRQGVRVTIISRGYGAEAGSRNDEALELEQNLPDVPHLQNPDRVAAARTAIDELDCQLILLDDAFQHRRIGRDLDIVLLDALEPFGFDHLLPRGTLREPLDGLRRADVVVLSRADLVDSRERDRIRRRVRQYAPDATWVEVAHRPQGLLSADGNEQPLEALAGKRVAAFCGIGNPEGFRRTLDACDLQIADFRTFPDHHPYDRSDVASLETWLSDLDVAAAVCTHKDLVKLQTDRLGQTPFRALRIGIQILAGQPDFEADLSSLLDPSQQSTPYTTG